MTNKLIHHHKNHHHHHHILPPPPRSTSTIQACAACRYQRRKCAPDCILAPYFPHDRQRQFQNAHKLFGVSNITKIIRHLDRPQKDEAMRTIIYQSDVRSIDPVGGCYRIIQQLQRQIEISCAELDFVLQQLTLCRTLCIQNNNNNNNNNNSNNHNHNNNNININNNNNDDDDQINDQQFSHDLIVIDEIDYNIHLVNNPDEPHLYDDNNNSNIKYNNNNNNNNNNNVHVVPRVHGSSHPTLHVSVCDDFKSILINEVNPESELRKEENESSEKILFDEENYQKDMIKVENVCYNEEQYHEIV